MHRRWRAASCSFAAALSATTACSLFADFDVVTDAGAGADARTSDVADARANDGDNGDAAASDGALLPGVVFSDGFESAIPTCGWMVEEGTATPDTIARTGGGACRLCSTGGRIRIERNLPERRAGSYQLVAHYRQLPGKTTPTRWAIRLTATTDAGSPADENTGVLGQAYGEAQTTIVTTAEANRVVARIGVEQSTDAGDCLLVDDITASWSPP